MVARLVQKDTKGLGGADGTNSSVPMNARMGYHQPRRSIGTARGGGVTVRNITEQIRWHW
jgi:hypothetical protein